MYIIHMIDVLSLILIVVGFYQLSCDDSVRLVWVEGVSKTALGDQICQWIVYNQFIDLSYILENYKQNQFLIFNECFKIQNQFIN